MPGQLHDSGLIEVPLKVWAKELAKEAAREAIAEHKANCQILTVQSDLANLKLGFAKLIAFMVGSGLLGGGMVLGIAKGFGLLNGH